MALEIVRLEHLPAEYTVHLALFRNIQNAAFLHSQLLARNADFEYGFVDASVVVSRNQVLSAAFRAVNAAATESLKTPNVHSEIVTNLSASTNIAEAYRRYGITKDTKDLLVLKVTKNGEPTTESIASHLSTNVEGEQLAATDENIAAITDLSKVSKYYKLNGLNWLEKIDNPAAKHKELEMLVLGSMALKGI